MWHSRMQSPCSVLPCMERDGMQGGRIPSRVTHEPMLLLRLHCIIFFFFVLLLDSGMALRYLGTDMAFTLWDLPIHWFLQFFSHSLFFVSINTLGSECILSHRDFPFIRRSFLNQIYTHRDHPWYVYYALLYLIRFFG